MKVMKTALKAMIPFLKELDAVKEPSHVIGGHALIKSLPGCPKQAAHTDYFSMPSHGKVKGRTVPYSCLLALEEGSFFYLNEEKISLSKGSVIILRGDVVHSGSEYDKDNIRYHIYMDVAGEHEARSADHVHWV